MPAPTAVSLYQQKPSGFWRRLAAFLVDCSILGMVGLATGLILTNQFASMGAWGRLVGFFVALLYFGFFNSEHTDGQTPGKRLFKIKVVSTDGAPLSMARAVLRFMPIGIPWFLNNLPLSGQALFSFWITLLSVAVFGIGLSVIYLSIFNRQFRQSAHDLLVGSCVTFANGSGPVEPTQVWRMHLAACCGFLVLSAAGPMYTSHIATSEPFPTLLNITRSAEREPWVDHVQVNLGRSIVSSSSDGKSSTTFYNIAAYSSDNDIDNAGRAKRLAMLALSANTAVADATLIRVTLVHGYDIGIAKSWRARTFAHSPSEWKAY